MSTLPGKRLRTGSISGRLRTASDLEESGLIDKYQKGYIKDLIISGDSEFQLILDKYEKGDKKDLEALIRGGYLSRNQSIDLLDDLDFDFLNGMLKNTNADPQSYDDNAFDDLMFDFSSDTLLLNNSTIDVNNNNNSNSFQTQHIASVSGNHYNKPRTSSLDSISSYNLGFFDNITAQSLDTNNSSLLEEIRFLNNNHYQQQMPHHRNSSQSISDVASHTGVSIRSQPPHTSSTYQQQQQQSINSAPPPPPYSSFGQYVSSIGLLDYEPLLLSHSTTTNNNNNNNNNSTIAASNNTNVIRATENHNSDNGTGIIDTTFNYKNIGSGSINNKINKLRSESILWNIPSAVVNTAADVGGTGGDVRQSQQQQPSQIMKNKSIPKGKTTSAQFSGTTVVNYPQGRKKVISQDHNNTTTATLSSLQQQHQTMRTPPYLTQGSAAIYPYHHQQPHQQHHSYDNTTTNNTTTTTYKGDVGSNQSTNMHHMLQQQQQQGMVLSNSKINNKTINNNNILNKHLNYMEQNIVSSQPYSTTLHLPDNPCGNYDSSNKTFIATSTNSSNNIGNSLDISNFVGVYSPEQRKLRIERFIEKRQKRIWTKKVKYDVRKNFADSRLRVKGRFVKKEDEDIMREILEI